MTYLIVFRGDEKLGYNPPFTVRDAGALPRIGETLRTCGSAYVVTDVVHHAFLLDRAACVAETPEVHVRLKVDP